MTKLIEVSSIPTYLPTYLPTYPPTCLPTYLPTHLPTNLPTYWLLLFSSGRGLLAAPKQEVCILGWWSISDRVRHERGGGHKKVTKIKAPIVDFNIKAKLNLPTTW